MNVLSPLMCLPFLSGRFPRSLFWKERIRSSVSSRNIRMAFCSDWSAGMEDSSTSSIDARSGVRVTSILSVLQVDNVEQGELVPLLLVRGS